MVRSVVRSTAEVSRTLEDWIGRLKSWPSSEKESMALAKAVFELTGAELVIVQIAPLGMKAFSSYGKSVPGAELVSEALFQKQDAIKGAFFEGQIPQKSYFSQMGFPVTFYQGVSLPDGAYVIAAQKQNEREELSRQLKKTALLGLREHLIALHKQKEFREELSQRDQFLSIAAHELKTPLTSIYSMLQLQSRFLEKEKESAGTRERLQSMLKIVLGQTERLNELIDALLNVSRIYNGRFVVDPSDSNVVELLERTIEGRLSVIAAESNIEVKLEADPIHHAWVDPIRFEEVVTNIGMNSIRFSPEGGTVWIKMKQQGDDLYLTFRDQGPPIPAEDRERIFHPFERVQRTSRLGGLGLGLFISREIVRLHGGDVTLLESSESTGNIFSARFSRALQSVNRMPA